jgi:hypothetical protein
MAEPDTRESHSPLHQHVRVARGVQRPEDGFFLRAENFFNVATESQRLDSEPERFFRGLDSKRGEHVDWLDCDLAVGDEIVLRVVDVVKPGAPKKGSRRPVGDTRRRQKAHVRR